MGVKNNRFNIRSSWWDSYVSGKSKTYKTAQLGELKDVGVWGPTSVLSSTQLFTSPSASVTLSTLSLEIIAVGAGGGAPGHPTPNPGGQGGISIARYNLPIVTPIIVLVGGSGVNGQPGPGAAGAGYDPTSINTGAGGPGYADYGITYGGTGGGGASGVFVGSVTQGNALVVAGGGGGEAYAGYGPDGGHGGGPIGGTGGSPGTSTGGGGGSNPANSGGAHGADQPGRPTPPPGGPIPYDGTALQGGANHAKHNSDLAYAGGGGGGGYWGGGAGGASASTGGSNGSGGGGGSGYFRSTDMPQPAPMGDIEYYPSPTVERNYQGMGYVPGEQGTGGPYPLGAGKDHPQLSPLATEYGNGGIQGYVILNFYTS